MKHMYLALAGLVACSTAQASSGSSEYRTVSCSTYGDTVMLYTGIDRRVLERSVLTVVRDTADHSVVVMPSFLTASGGVQARVNCAGTVDFVREY